MSLPLLRMLSKKYYFNIKLKWYEELKQQSPNSVKIFVGNKIDLRPIDEIDEKKFVPFTIAQ